MQCYARGILRHDLLLLPFAFLPGFQLVSFTIEEEVQFGSLLQKTSFLLSLVRGMCVWERGCEGEGGESVCV